MTQTISEALNQKKPLERVLSPAEQCMRNIERVTNGGKMSAAQRHVYESCKRMVEGRAPKEPMA